MNTRLADESSSVEVLYTALDALTDAKQQLEKVLVLRASYDMSYEGDKLIAIIR